MSLENLEMLKTSFRISFMKRLIKNLMFISRKSGSNLFQQKSYEIFSSKQYQKITKNNTDKMISFTELQKISIKSITVNICKRTLFKIR